MKPSNENVGTTLDRLLAQHANPSSERMQSAINRVEEYLQGLSAEEPAMDVAPVPIVRRPLRFFVAAGAVRLYAVELSEHRL